MGTLSKSVPTYYPIAMTIQSGCPYPASASMDVELFFNTRRKHEGSIHPNRAQRPQVGGTSMNGGGSNVLWTILVVLAIIALIIFIFIF